MKKIIPAALLIFFISASPVSAASASLSLSPSSGSFNKGCAFSLEIKVDTSNTQTDGTDAILFYDSSRFTAVGIRSGTIYSDYPGNSIDTQNGKITVSGLSSISSAFSGSGTLATIDFEVLEEAPTGVTQVRFDFDPNDKAKTTDSNVVERGTVSDILGSASGGNYTISEGSCGVVTPTGTDAIISGAPQGGTEIITQVPIKKPLPPAADFQTTLMIGAAGTILTILGIIGLVLL